MSALNEIIAFIYDDYRQVMLAAHKRMDLVVGSLIMTGKAKVRNKGQGAERAGSDRVPRHRTSDEHHRFAGQRHRRGQQEEDGNVFDEQAQRDCPRLR